MSMHEQFSTPETRNLESGMSFQPRMNGIFAVLKLLAIRG